MIDAERFWSEPQTEEAIEAYWSTDQYARRPTKLRVHHDGVCWSVDGIDEEGNYTEECWTFPTHAEAIAALPAFRAEYSYETDSRGVVEVLDRAAYVAGHPNAIVAECGGCGRSWDDAVVTGVTPTPSARCPFEHEHEEEAAR